MKTAVLLLIGAAVIGPIDGVSVTHAELCARAMRDIGWNGLDKQYLGPASDGKWLPLVGGLPVRCIPVPEGYRR